MHIPAEAYEDLKAAKQDEISAGQESKSQTEIIIIIMFVACHYYRCLLIWLVVVVVVIICVLLLVCLLLSLFSAGQEQIANQEYSESRILGSSLWTW